MNTRIALIIVIWIFELLKNKIFQYVRSSPWILFFVYIYEIYWRFIYMSTRFIHSMLEYTPVHSISFQWYEHEYYLLSTKDLRISVFRLLRILSQLKKHTSNGPFVWKKNTLRYFTDCRFIQFMRRIFFRYITLKTLQKDEYFQRYSSFYNNCYIRMMIEWNTIIISFHLLPNTWFWRFHSVGKYSNS